MTSRQHGATMVEFALTLVLFLTFLLGIVDFSRMLYTWGAANEATRAGARYAVVCHDAAGSTGPVLTRMQALVPQIQSIDLAWEPTGCTPATCIGVTVRVTGMQHQWISPVAGLSMLAPFTMPSFATFLTREAMGQDSNSGSIC